MNKTMKVLELENVRWLVTVYSTSSALMDRYYHPISVDVKIKVSMSIHLLDITSYHRNSITCQKHS